MLKLHATRKSRRPLLASAIVVLAGLAATPATDAAHRIRVAHTAAALRGTATAHLHLIEAEGSELIETGRVTGTLTGSAHAELRTGATFTARFSIRTSTGTIRGHGTATPHGLGRFQSFSGSFTATSGTGRYKDIHGHAGLYGTIDRNTDSVVIQAVSNATLTY